MRTFFLCSLRKMAQLSAKLSLRAERVGGSFSLSVTRNNVDSATLYWWHTHTHIHSMMAMNLFIELQVNVCVCVIFFVAAKLQVPWNGNLLTYLCTLVVMVVGAAGKYFFCLKLLFSKVIIK